MFLVLNSRQTLIANFVRSFSAAFFIVVHLHVLALVRLSERSVFGAVPPVPSLSPSSAAAPSLGAPVAFPIFRPPMVPVHRQKTTLEQERAAAAQDDPRHSPLSQNHSATTSEQRPVHSAGASSLSSSSVAADEEEANLDHHQQQREEEGTTFSPMPIFSLHKMGNTSSNINNLSAPPVPFHRLDTFGAIRRDGKDDAIADLTSVGSDQLLSTPPSISGRTGSNSAVPFSAIQSIARHIPHTNTAMRSSIPPQFPVFTGMGMEIIESGEGDGERGATSAAAGSGEDHWHSLQRKMHYNFTNDSKLTGRKTNQKIFTGEHSNINGTTDKSLNTQIATTTTSRPSSSFVPPTSIRIEPIGDSSTQTVGMVVNSKQPTSTAEDEVTEDLLAIFTSTSGPFVQSEHSSKKAFPKLTVEEQRIALEKQTAAGGGDSSTQIHSRMLPTVGPDEEIIPRPTVTHKTPGNEQMGGQNLSQTNWPTTTTPAQRRTSSITTTASGQSTTKLPVITTIGVMATTATTAVETIRTVVPKTTQITAEHFVNKDGILTEELDGRITIGTGRNGPTTTMTKSTTASAQWIGGNHIEERVEVTSTTQSQSGKISTTAPNWGITRQQNNVQNKKTSETTNRVAERLDGSANLRLLIISAIIAVLFVAVGIGSICTGRYVRKSRQLHGKYRPAAYELQTARPPPSVGSSAPLPFPPRITNCNMPQQNRQHFEFGDMHQMPSHHQLILNESDGREERLI